MSKFRAIKPIIWVLLAYPAFDGVSPSHADPKTPQPSSAENWAIDEDEQKRLQAHISAVKQATAAGAGQKSDTSESRRFGDSNFEEKKLAELKAKEEEEANRAKTELENSTPQPRDRAEVLKHTQTIMQKFKSIEQSRTK